LAGAGALVSNLIYRLFIPLAKRKREYEVNENNETDESAENSLRLFRYFRLSRILSSHIGQKQKCEEERYDASNPVDSAPLLGDRDSRPAAARAG
jgi:hypothetical protein